MSNRLSRIVKIDGIDGCGKSTLVHRLAAHYRDRLSVHVTSEFRGDELEQLVILGEHKQSSRRSHALFELAMSLAGDAISREVLFATQSRTQNQHLAAIRGKFDLILSDRSSLTGLAYGHEFGEAFKQFFDWAVTPIVQEDLILWLDCDVGQAAARRDQRGEGLDAVEQQGAAFQQAAAWRFQQLAEVLPQVTAIDAQQGEAAVLEQACLAIDQLIGCSA